MVYSILNSKYCNVLHLQIKALGFFYLPCNCLTELSIAGLAGRIQDCGGNGRSKLLKDKLLIFVGSDLSFSCLMLSTAVTPEAIFAEVGFENPRCISGCCFCNCFLLVRYLWRSNLCVVVSYKENLNISNKGIP